MCLLKDKVLRLVDQGDIESRDDCANLYYQEAIDLLAKYLKTNPSDADANYMLGYVWYCFRSNEEKRYSEVEKNLLKAISLDSSHNFSNLYLGHLYFDHEMYREALERFRNVDTEEFVKLNQLWRGLVVDELILCCKLFLGVEEVSVGEVNSFFERYYKLSEEDRPNLIELKRVLQKLIEVDVESTSIVRYLIQDKLKGL